MEQFYDIIKRQGIDDDYMHLKMKKPTKEECDIQPYEIEIIYIDDQLERYRKTNKIKAPKGSYRTIKLKDMPIIDKVIFNPPATIVMWDDGTKTVVKASGESFSEEVGLCEAIAKRYFGNRSKLKKAIKDAKRPEEEKE